MKNYLIIILLLLSITSFGQYERHGRITAKSVQLDSTWTPYNIRIGESYYDKDENTISTMLPNGVTLQNGQELFFDVINQTGATLTNGKVARFAGALGNSGKIKADYMIADGSYPAVGTIGVITEDIPNGEQGKITWFGKVRGINTTGTPYGETWNDGDTLYVHKDSLGGMTNIMPNAPDQKIWVAVVVKAHTSGTILVRPTFSTALKDLEDINGTPLDSSGQFLVWDNTNQYFDFDYNINDYATIDTLLHYYLIAADSLGEQRDDINRIDNDYVEKASSSTDNAIARFDGTTGKVIQNSNVIVSDLGKVTATTGIFTNLTNGYVPYHSSDVNGLVDGPFFINGSTAAIGTQNPFGAKFAVYSSGLGTTTGNYLALTTQAFSGGTTNTIKRFVWAYRNEDGSDWTTTSVHDGIGVDESYNVPRSTTRTWYERDPQGGRHYWGNAATQYLELGGSGAVFTVPATATSFINSVVNDAEETLQSDGSTKNFFDYSESLKLDSLKVGDATNNTEIKDDGTVVLNGTATAFDDLTFPVSTLKSIGVANKPDYNTTDLGLSFPDADTTEMIGVSVQMPHAWKEGSSISPHIHIIQTSADTAIFGISYRIYNLGETVPSWTTVFTYDHAYEWSSGSMLQILEFPMIDMTGKTISSQIDIKVWRRTVDNIVGDVLLKQFDIHYEVDGFGSSTEYTK